MGDFIVRIQLPDATAEHDAERDGPRTLTRGQLVTIAILALAAIPVIPLVRHVIRYYRAQRIQADFQEMGGHVVFAYEVPGWLCSAVYRIQEGRYARYLETDIEAAELGGTIANDQTVSRLAHYSELKFINLESTLVTDGALPYLARMPVLAAVQLGSTGVHGSDLSRLKGLPTLRKLSLPDCQLNESEMDFFRQCSSLEYLDLGYSGITDLTIRRLAEAPKLAALSLAGNKLTSDSFETIARIRSLKALDLSSTPVVRGGLARLKALPELKCLYLRDYPFTEEAAREISDFPRLEALGLSDDASPEGVQIVREHVRSLRSVKTPNALALPDWAFDHPESIFEPATFPEFVYGKGGGVF